MLASHSVSGGSSVRSENCSGVRQRTTVGSTGGAGALSSSGESVVIADELHFDGQGRPRHPAFGGEHLAIALNAERQAGAIGKGKPVLLRDEIESGAGLRQRLVERNNRNR